MIPSAQLFNETLTGNKTSAPMDASWTKYGAATIDHPTGPTTTYTIEFSPQTPQQVKDVPTLDLWYDSGTVIPAKSAAEVFSVKFEVPGPRFRVRANTTANPGGTGRIWGHTKP